MGPKELRTLMLEMHNAYWGPFVEPVERQETELRWLARIDPLIKAWEAERRAADALAEAVRTQYAYSGYMTAPGIGDALGEYRKVQDGE